MQIHHASIVLCCCAILSHAQAPRPAQPPSLADLRAKYDAPFTRNLQSFNCAVDFSWKQHWVETTRVGDEGTDQELDKIFQPIHNRVTVTPQAVTVSSGMTGDEIGKLPHGGMAEFLLEHAIQKSLYTWLPAGTYAILPPAGAPVQFEPSSSGYKLAYKMQNLDVEMGLTSDMRLENAALKAAQPQRFDTTFAPGPNGFVLTSWTLSEDGITEPGHRVIFTYTYHAVDGIQLPEHVTINRESHHEVWRYTLKDCTVKTSK